MTALGRYPLVARSCIAVSTVLVATSVATHYLAYRLQVADPGADVIAALSWLDVNAERNVPTAWSTLLLLAAALTAGVLALRGAAMGRGWSLVSVTAGFLALDESLELHERLTPAGTALVGEVLHFAWVVPGAFAGAVVGTVLLLRLRRQPVLIRRRLVLSGVVYLTGALLLETLSGVVLRYDGPREPYIVVTALEELLEMVGASLLVATVLAVPRRADVDDGRTEGRTAARPGAAPAGSSSPWACPRGRACRRRAAASP